MREMLKEAVGVSAEIGVSWSYFMPVASKADSTHLCTYPESSWRVSCLRPFHSIKLT